MRLRNIPGAREEIENSELCILEEQPSAGKWNKIFGNDNPVRIEIGCGKGRFITALAAKNPQINYIGIEKYSSVLIKALQKALSYKPALENIRFIRMDAQIINTMFGENEVDRIYLNFSDPWPKDRHAKRRLTSREYLRRYDKILKPGGIVEFKTDNEKLFCFSLEEAPAAGWHIDACTFDLHNDDQMNAGNIMTEYEQKFSAEGNPIYKMIISR